jgi:hypothetical protein
VEMGERKRKGVEGCEKRKRGDKGGKRVEQPEIWLLDPARRESKGRPFGGIRKPLAEGEAIGGGFAIEAIQRPGMEDFQLIEQVDLREILGQGAPISGISGMETKLGEPIGEILFEGFWDGMIHKPTSSAAKRT